MKKILLFLMLASLNLVAQTPIWHYTFNGNSSPVNPQGNYGGSLFKVSGGTTNASNFGKDRFGNSGSSLIVKNQTDFTYYANLANLPQGNNPRSFSFWLRIKNPGNQSLFSYGGTTNSNMFGMSIPSTTTVAYIVTGPTTYAQFSNQWHPRYVSTNSSDQDAWIHYIVTAEASGTKIYKNGVLMATNPITLTTSGTNIRFGLPLMDSNTTDNTLDFLLDDFKIYNQVLTQAQIKQMYVDEVAFNPTNLVAYYGFENNLDCTNNSAYNLTAQNPAENTYETGIIGQSRRFLYNPVYNDAIGQAINYGEFTIMAWEKTNVNQSGLDFATVYELGASLYARRRQSLFKTGYASNATTFLGEGSTSINPISEWVHHTVTVKNYNGSFNAVYYRNGELLSKTADNTATTSVYSFINKFVIAGGIDGNGNLLTSKRLQNSNIDEVYIYNRVLNQPEILATMYRTTAPTFLATKETKKDNLISLVPNPATDDFSVVSKNQKISNISIVDYLGRKILETQNKNINISKLPKSNYIVKIELQNGEVIVKKLMKK